jgi:Uma2 family endonuclease
MVYRLEQNDEYGKAEVFTKDERISSRLFAELEIELKEIFPEA